MRSVRRQPPPQRAACTTACIVLIFCIAATAASPAQTLTTLVDFNVGNGFSPSAPPVQGTGGDFYGTTLGCGSNFGGTIFKMTPGGALTTLYGFCSLPNCADGTDPAAPLVQGTDGDFYGTTFGQSNQICAPACGTVFKITSRGIFANLYNFCSQPNCADGQNPSGLVQATDGNFYGSAAPPVGGNAGTIFRISPTGAFSTFYRFCSQPDCTDGAGSSALIQGSDGNLYGTTSGGGAHGFGTVFRITLGGALTTLYNFCPQPGCADGSGGEPLTQASDGNFYGVSPGGVNNDGTVFQVTPAGAFITIHTFNFNEGDEVQPKLLQGSDGNLYGLFLEDQQTFGGRVYRLTTTGTLTIVYEFCSQPNCTDGAGPANGLSQGLDGNFYGVTVAGGTDNDCTGGCGTAFRLSGPNPAGLQFTAVTPCRLVDTRQSSPIQGGTTQSFPLPQLGGCTIPSSATAYSLNVTVVPRHPLGYLTIWPTGQGQPYVSTLNSLDGRTKANAAIVPSGGSASAVSVYVTDTSDVVLDIDGYFTAPSQSTLKFYPLTPCRVADTRKDTFPQGLGTPHLSAGVARDFPVLNATSCNIPSNAQAYSLNFTAIPYPDLGDQLGYLEVWPTGQQPQHPVSTLNNPTGTFVANAAIAPAGTGNDITVYASSDTDLAIDINGYFAAPGTGGLSLYPAPPCRVIDTRKIGSGQPFSGSLMPPVDVVDSGCGVPSTAAGYVFNATVVPSPSLSYLTLWPDGQNQPVASTLNAADGWITSNMAIVPSTNGSVDAYAAGMTQLILDISAYFTP